MMDNGKTIRCMDGENCIMKMVNLPIKGIGSMMNFMAMGKYIMMNHNRLRSNLIIPISIYWVITGITMKATWLMIPKRAVGRLY